MGLSVFLRPLAVGVICLGLAVAGCSEEETTGGGKGGSSGAGGAGGGARGGAGGGAAGGAGGGAAGGSSGDSGGATVTYSQVQPIFMAKCMACHGSAASGMHRIATMYADAIKMVSGTYPACAGKKVGECALIRIKDGSMPLGQGCNVNRATKTSCPQDTDIALIEQWVAGGLKE